MMTIREAAAILLARVRGDEYDGHTFLDQAQAAGAAAAMVDSRRERLSELPLIVVGNTRVAFGTLARQWRARFSMPLVAITGSSGKTTVKEMLAAILRK